MSRKATTASSGKYPSIQWILFHAQFGGDGSTRVTCTRAQQKKRGVRKFEWQFGRRVNWED
eukprot:768143-Pleurochrysis_carterae.AAC.1